MVWPYRVSIAGSSVLATVIANRVAPIPPKPSDRNTGSRKTSRPVNAAATVRPDTIIVRPAVAWAYRTAAATSEESPFVGSDEWFRRWSLNAPINRSP